MNEWWVSVGWGYGEERGRRRGRGEGIEAEGMEIGEEYRGGRWLYGGGRRRGYRHSLGSEGIKVSPSKWKRKVSLRQIGAVCPSSRIPLPHFHSVDDRPCYLVYWTGLFPFSFLLINIHTHTFFNSPFLFLIFRRIAFFLLLINDHRYPYWSIIYHVNR